MTDLSGHAPGPPPSFANAKGRRQRARAAGLDPNHWYAVVRASDLKPGQVMETEFWGRSIAVFRGQDGRVRAVENRCAHRHLKLTDGEVVDCRLVCPYHGWSYAGDGKAKIPHDLFGRKDPSISIESIPARERYGLVFIFPGDVKLATVKDIPSIPELEGDNPWPHAIVQFDCEGHHSMILENVSDFTHGFLHRKFNPFGESELLRCETIGDRVELQYRAKIAAGRLQNMFINRAESDCDNMTACFDYPYHWSNTDDRIKHFLFTLPKNSRENRHIFIFYVSPTAIKMPFLGPRIPQWLMHRMMKAQRWITLQPLLGQDVWVLKREQEGWERHWHRPAPEFSPVVNAFQDLTIRKWEDYLQRTQSNADDGRVHLPSAPIEATPPEATPTEATQ